MPTPPEPIAAIVLAAGRSTRMGGQKMLLEIDGEPLVRRSVRVAFAAGLDPVVVVVGHERQPVVDALEGLGCRVVFNPEVAAPMSRSLHHGLRAVPGEASAAVVILPDMYRVTDAMLRTVVEAAGKSDAPLVASRYGTVVAPPMLFRRRLFDELLAFDGESAGKAVAQKHAADALFLDWPADALRDLDTPADLAQLTSSALETAAQKGH